MIRLTARMTTTNAMKVSSCPSMRAPFRAHHKCCGEGHVHTSAKILRAGVRERFAGEHLERGEHAARSVRHVRQLQAHLDSAERAGQCQVVEIAEMADAEDLSLQLAEARAERHVEGKDLPH